MLEDESDDGEQGEKLRGLLQKEPFLLTVSDPYSGYTAMHWAAKVIKISLAVFSSPEFSSGGGGDIFL